MRYAAEISVLKQFKRQFFSCLEKREEEVWLPFPEECTGGHGRPPAVRGCGEDASLHQGGQAPHPPLVTPSTL